MMNGSGQLLECLKQWMPVVFQEQTTFAAALCTRLSHLERMATIKSRLVRVVRRNLRNCVEPGKLRAYRPTEKPGELQV